MKKTYEKDVDYLAGETVNGGTYNCTRCDHRLQIPEGKVTNLPVCPSCQGQQWQTAA